MAAERDDQRQEMTPGRPPAEGEELRNITDKQKKELEGAAITTGVGLGCLGTIFSPFIVGLLILAVVAIIGFVCLFFWHGGHAATH